MEVLISGWVGKSGKIKSVGGGGGGGCQNKWGSGEVGHFNKIKRKRLTSYSRKVEDLISGKVLIRMGGWKNFWKKNKKISRREDAY